MTAAFDPLRPIPGPDPGACPKCGRWRKAGMVHVCEERDPPPEIPSAAYQSASLLSGLVVDLDDRYYPMFAGHAIAERTDGHDESADLWETFCLQWRELVAWAKHDSAEREFLDASVAVWREIDKHIDGGGRYKRGVPETLTTDAELRRIEREAWNRYRRLLDVVALPKVATKWPRVADSAASSSDD